MEIVLVVLVVAVFMALGYVLARRAGRQAGLVQPEALILEEAELLEAMAPGLQCRAILRRKGADGGAADSSGRGIELRIKATDPSLAFPRGTRVRLLDWSEGVYLVEAADAEHLVR